MKSATIIGGGSHPELLHLISNRLGITPCDVSLKRFANGETSVEIRESVRDKDVFILQSGSSTVNDSLMELLIIISACKGGSAKRITAVMPYFPYSKQSKMRKYRDAITARMVANLLTVAGVDHIITLDLHASQMQGFFTRPVDNLYAEPNIAEWIRRNVDDWEEAVVVSKNPGGAKRVTSLADTLNLDFALINTDRQRSSHFSQNFEDSIMDETEATETHVTNCSVYLDRPRIHTAKYLLGHIIDDEEIITTPASVCSEDYAQEVNLYSQGGCPSDDDEEENIMSASIYAERMITLVGDVNGKTALLIDDTIENPTAFIVASEHLVKRCGAKRVIVIGTHGIFQNKCLKDLQSCEYIEQIVVTNTYPIKPQAVLECDKLTVIDISGVLAEAIRRTHNGESISFLFKKAF
ncbi:Ribose-phosphate diphosphokinase [Schizosaccharomyces pombe]|uniref:Ribose-phosphate pyrophosphokinase 1 n=1 Tax=Schizosaccharomyces pombe (strain 972 / ATCC 24843) TaxID=284812 RepID=KPR1_SCHPO|nr:putative ribose-phosphate pyrophosphokinase [Schizosaccharomyces pombe]P41831.1 RecName: Full=Ribose-phosphate pyrophosphokinase 1; AltName: Full=Phosphoribosyl pyrophosphate synthase 1 [Schizosaccharomyces pombe 972h-]CAA58747.1 phosphoribosyl pyrophosphate synthetase [Schizosaccharomyces pombe]CAB11484.1 ribose-phosphate pyrophosphokinase (predicted) [Schizosaccharomyces pombe]|eukprot:NP_593826.1 putative ribose-phosphate pyrophosphokinase [Schizosaccharomyces pombe]